MRTGHRFIVTTIVAALVVPVLARRVSADPAPPNIVFILVDDVGREVLGCSGG